MGEDEQRTPDEVELREVTVVNLNPITNLDNMEARAELLADRTFPTPLRSTIAAILARYLAAEPILSLKSKIIFIKKVKKGMGVSYGRTFVASSPTRIATVAIGYADGYPWSLSGRAMVIIKNSFFNLAGRVCMDHIMVDLGKRDDIKVGDEVILLGAMDTIKITSEDLAKQAGTIPYEIVSRLSHKIPRLYKK